MRDKGFSKMRLKILLQLLIFILIKYFKYEKKINNNIKTENFIKSKEKF